MNLPGTTIHKLIDNLTRSPFSFALYRLPWTDEPILVLQEEEDVEVLNSPAALNGKRGFVMTPFHQTEEYPAVLIRPDKVAHEWEISVSLSKHLPHQYHLNFPHPSIQKKKEVLMLRKQKKNMNRFSPVSFHH